ncbi:MAG: class I SAM-dependent methyltransferase [Lysobacteraceae bacterium]
MTPAPDPRGLEADVLARDWFYRFTLPSGAVTGSAHAPDILAIHDTRWAMAQACLRDAFPEGAARASAVDLACHQGWFSLKLREFGFGSVHGIDARQQHVEDARLIASATGADHVAFSRGDVHERAPAIAGTHELVLCFGLLYHLENPVGALRVARALCKRLCLIETQVAPGQTGVVDYGSYRFVKPIEGSFVIVDETDETHGPEASTLGISLIPSLEALHFILRKVGFSKVDVLPVPEDGYEQLRYGKRVVLAARV